MGEFGGSSQTGATRREALKKGAAIAGATMWATPVIQALTVSPASADRPSGGHIDSGRGNGSSPPGADLDPGRSGPVNKGGD
ncbi:MAG TPA: hypothetical protein VHM89_03585 [Acidimicrobiales bacterium]|nr:hypothetical protein [Acidimicrobiales bacterium]